MAMRRIFLVRHGTPDLPDTPVYLGRTDVPLSPEGHRQAGQLAAYLAGQSMTVYTSPLRRCLETACALGETPIPVPGLREIDMGAWELRPRAEIKAQFPALYEARGQDLAHFRPPMGESFAQCATRAWAAFRSILRESEGDVAIVAHAGVNRALLCWVTGRPIRELLAFPQSYCGVTTLRLGAGGLALEALDHCPWGGERGGRVG